MYNDLSHYLLMISIFSAFIIKYSSITQRWILSFYFIVSSLSFYAALVGYIDSDFSVYNIFTNSNANTPLFYKISSTWSNHEGSLLLWCWFLTLYGFVFCYSITIFESNRKNCSMEKQQHKNCSFRERSFYELLSCNTALKNSIDKLQLGKNHAILFVNQSQKQPLFFVPDNKQEQTKLYFQALLKNPLESLIQEKQLYPQKYTEIDHLGSFKRFQPKAKNNTYSMQKKLYRHDLKNTDFFVRTLNCSYLFCSFCGSKQKKSISWPYFEVYSNRNRFNTAWISFSFSKFNQWTNTRQRTQPFVIYVSIILWFLAFLLMTSNPFLKTPFLCINSYTELNPVLQDPVLAIHPPCIYAGYVASAIGFSIALSYLSQPFLFVATATTTEQKNRGKHIQKERKEELQNKKQQLGDSLFFVLQFFVVLTKITKIWNTFHATKRKERKEGLQNKKQQFGVLSIQTLVDKTKTQRQWTCFLLLTAARVRTIVQQQLMLLFWPLACFFWMRLTKISGVFFLGQKKQTFHWLFKQEGCKTKKKTQKSCDSTAVELQLQLERTPFFFDRKLQLDKLQLEHTSKAALQHKDQHKTSFWFTQQQLQQQQKEVFPFLLLPNIDNIGASSFLFLKSPNFQLQLAEDKWLLAEFTKQTRFWMLTCWCFLTVGILLGSWWAYHELGWGGWWFWDPVENASLMPWLLATACIHSVLAPTAVSRTAVSRNTSLVKQLQSWTFLLSIVTFMLSILGTFFVRSGLLASVHSFATDSTRGLFILCFLLCVFFLSITFFIRWLFFFNYNNQLGLEVPKAANKKLQLEGKQQLQFKLPFFSAAGTATHKYKKEIEQVLQIQNVILCIICLVILCGTAAPILFQWLFQRDVSTGASFFNATTIPLFVTAILVMIYVHYAQLIYLKNSRSEKIALWEWSVFYPNCMKQKKTQEAHPKSTAAASAFSALSVCTLKTPLLWEKSKMRSLVLLSAAAVRVGLSPLLSFLLQLSYSRFSISILSQAALRSFVEYRVHILDNHSTFCFFCSVFVFLSHVLILHYLTDFSYLESILAALCFVLCCYIVMSSTHQTSELKTAVNSTKISKKTATLSSKSSKSSKNKKCSLTSEKMKGHQCNKSGTWSLFKAENIAMGLLSVDNRVVFLLTQFSSKAEKTPNVLSEMKHKSFLTTASRLIMLIDKNPFRRIAFNMRLSHIGVLVFLIGVIVSNRKKIQLVQIMRFGQQVQLDNGICSLRSIDQNYGPTYHSICGNIIIQPQTYKHVTSADLFLGLNNWFCFPYENKKKHSKALCFLTYSKNTNSCVVTDGQEPHICMFPEKRFFFSNPTLSTTKVAIYTNLFTDFYALIGTGSAETGWYTTIMQLPFIFCIWIGFLVAACGGLYSLRLLLKTSHLKWK